MKSFRKYLTEASKENLGYVHARMYDVIRIANDIDKLIGKFKYDVGGANASWARTVAENAADHLSGFKKSLEDLYKEENK